MTWYYWFASLCNPFFLLFVRIKSRSSSKPRVRVVVRNQKGEVLLLKSVFGMKEWEFPGGEVGAGEAEKTAVVRELKEETALVISEDTLVKRQTLLRPFPIELFECRERVVSNAKIVRPFEIRAIRWCGPHKLPVDTALYVKHFLQNK